MESTTQGQVLKLANGEERIAYIKACKFGGNEYSWFVKADGDEAKEELHLQSFVEQNFGRHGGLIAHCKSNHGEWHGVPCEQISLLKYSADGKWFGKAFGEGKEWEPLDFDSFVEPSFGVEDGGVFLTHCQAKPGKERPIPPGKVTTRGRSGGVTAELALDCTGVARPQPCAGGSAPSVKYQQGNNSTCVISSVASAMHAFGVSIGSTSVQRAAESLVARAKESIKQSVNRIDFLQQVVMKELKGWRIPEQVLSGDAAATFDCLATKSLYPACILIHGSDGSTDHCITTLGDWIFDSNKSHALPLCQASLDQCVDLGGEGVTFMGCAKVVKLVPSKKLLAVLGKRKRQSV